MGNRLQKRTAIKICGLTSADDASLVSRFDVDFAGIVLFYPKSRRSRTPKEAAEILAALRPGIQKVAVVVSPSFAETAQIERLGFDLIQIHGALPDELLAQISLPVLKAFNGTDFAQYRHYRDCGGIAGWVFDAPSPGSGKPFNWELLKTLPLDGHKKKPFLLAGGLTPDNVAEAVRLVHPDGVDVSSAVEYDGRPGKDPEKVAAFVQAVRGQA